MKKWLISKIPTWVLRYLVWRNHRLYNAGHSRNILRYWAAVELARREPPVLGPEKPVGFPEWLAKDPESYGYKDEPDRERSCSIVDQDNQITAWIFHPDIMSRVGEKVLKDGRIYDITEAGLVPYTGEKDD
ncbi:hypothetical protein LCGC14_3068410 [marine sediment metagenome]|uniref:Uncharacterized protein n=1 Tax=marine sediment metagenome TaxID=412755 RepID=A0A0F8X551_9ZZZZ